MEFAIAAGQGTLQYFRVPLQVDRKADRTPVTEADRSAELELRRRIQSAFPQDAILGEEFGETPGTSGYRWILDPIDGTKSFIHGIPFFGTLIGIEWGDTSVVGVICLPALQECLFGYAGGGAWLIRGDASPERVGVSQAESMSDGLFVTTSLQGFSGREALDVYYQLERAAGLTRTWGDCYGYYLVATGRALVMIDPVLELWDAAALLPILHEAGGTFTDWQGGVSIYAREAIATNGRVLEEVLQITRPFAR